MAPGSNCLPKPKEGFTCYPRDAESLLRVQTSWVRLAIVCYNSVL
jgi:hypothetical protein